MIKLFLLCLALLVAVWWVGRRFGRSRPELSTYLRTEKERNEREAAQMLRDNLHMPPGEALAPLISLARDIIPDNGPLRLDITSPQGGSSDGRRPDAPYFPCAPPIPQTARRDTSSSSGSPGRWDAAQSGRKGMLPFRSG